MSKIRSVKGMNDILPEEIARWHRLESTFRRHVTRYGFGEVRTPIVESTDLFVRSIGEATDIVEKEMYTFTDKGSKTLTLRPEGTASCARAYLQHTVGERSPVTKWAYIGPMYRRERPSRGRYRQFYQAGCEIYGDAGPYTDAEMIDMLVNLFTELGAKDVSVLVNSLGGAESRALYRKELVAYLSKHEASLSDESKRRLAVNPLRVLDSKAEADQEIAKNAPLIVDHLVDEDRAHFDGLTSALEALGTPYERAPRLVRGLDYYTRTVFEVKGQGGQLGAENTLCGGGRYDHLIKELGGKDTPAIGFAMGLERLLLVMDEEDASTPPAAFVVCSKEERAHASVLSRDLRKQGLCIDNDLRGQSIKSQMRRANKSDARYALIVGPDEVEKGTVQLKDLKGDAEQTEVPASDLFAKLTS